MLRTTSRRAVLALLAAVLALGGVAACGSGSAADTGDGGRVAVVAAFYPLQFITEQVGGDAVRVTNLVKPGAEPHDLELNPRQVAQVADAKLVVYIKDFQPALDDSVRQEAADRAFDVTTVSPLADKDPHIWLDPTRLKEITGRLAERLAGLDPAHALDFRTRALKLDQRLQQLDTEYADGLRTCQRREIVTSHAAFGYLAARYHLRQVAITGLSPEEEPAPGRLAEVARQAKQYHATTIFFETLVSPKISEAVAKEAGAKTAVLDPVEGLQPGSRDDYLSVMRSNLPTLRTALGCS
jgi:zinc transport system substrate-binding protein